MESLTMKYIGVHNAGLESEKLTTDSHGKSRSMGMEHGA